MVLRVSYCVVLYFHRREVRNQFLILKLVKTEPIALFQIIVVVLDISDNARCYLELYILS